MPFQKRCCATCLHFSAAPMGGTGWCKHPKIMQVDGVKILVRGNELRCRNNWDQDLWEGNQESQPRSPLAADAHHRDDQITTVSADGTSRPERPSAPRDDEVVIHPGGPLRDRSTVTAGRLDPNTPANNDQHDRVRAMHRGPGDAVREARQRALKRRQDEEGRARTEQTPVAASGESPSSSVGPEETGGTPLNAPSDDVLQSIEPARSSRDGGHASPRDLAPAQATPSPPEPTADDGRFDTIPEIRTDIDITRMRRFLTGAAPDAANIAPSTGNNGAEDDSGRPSTYDDVMRQAGMIRERNRAAPARLESALRPWREPRPIPEARSIPDDEPAVAPPPIDWDIDRSEIAAAFGIRGDSLAAGLERTGDAPARDDDPVASDFEEGPSRRRSWLGSFRRGGRHRHRTTEWATTDTVNDHDDWIDESPDGADPLVAEREWGDDRRAVFDAADGNRFPGDDRIIDEQEPWPAEETGSIELERSLTDDEFPWDPDTDEVLDTSFSNADDIADRVISDGFRDELPGHYDDAPATIAPSSHDGPASGRPLATFDLNDPEGFSAFRDALFNTDEPSQSGARPARRTRREIGNPYSFDVPQPRHAPSGRGPAGNERALDPEDVHNAGAGPSQRQRAPVAADTAPFDIREFIAEPDESVNLAVELAPHVPRSCSTCRDFRPSESGDRGWCTNAWAFDHRRMVNADDMPCHSSIGRWWLPHDEEWLPQIDHSTMEQPTPLTDALIARTSIHARDELDYRRRHASDRHEEQLYVREI